VLEKAEKAGGEHGIAAEMTDEMADVRLGRAGKSTLAIPT